MHTSELGLLLTISTPPTTTFVTVEREKRKYIQTTRHMRVCKRWGTYYTHRPDLDTSRCATQFEFDEYSYLQEQLSVVTKSCNGLVFELICFYTNQFTLDTSSGDAKKSMQYQTTITHFFRQKKISSIKL